MALAFDAPLKYLSNSSRVQPQTALNKRQISLGEPVVIFPTIALATIAEIGAVE